MQAIVVSDNADDRDFTAYVLRRAGFAVAPGSSLANVAANWLENPVDLVVVAGRVEGLTAGLPALRGVTEAPLVILMESPTEAAIIDLLGGGADLVLGTPVGARLLTAYCNGLLRRAGGIPPFTLPALDLGEIVLDPADRTVRAGERAPQRLTQLEFRLLYVLMTNRDQVIPSDIIVERVWGYTGTGSRELVRNLVSRLRSKIESDPGNPAYIQTVPGVGYQFGLPRR